MIVMVAFILPTIIMMKKQESVKRGEKMKIIPFYIESKNGHDTVGVPENQLQEKVVEQLNQEKWVTLEKEDGASELLTKSDIPTPQEVLEKIDEQQEIEKNEEIKEEESSDDDTEDEDSEDSEKKSDWTKAEKDEELKTKANNIMKFFGGNTNSNTIPSLTPKKEEPPKPIPKGEDFSKKFEKVKSATSTFKSKGG